MEIVKVILKSLVLFVGQHHAVFHLLRATGAWLLAASTLQAQSPSVDGFNPNLGGFVYTVAMQADGKMIVGGDFPFGIRRLNPDGTVDASFDPVIAGIVNSVALQADGKIVVGGEFETMTGLARANIGRLNSDGSVDAGFNPGVSGPDYPFVATLAVQSDGKILVGGGFDTLAGQSRANLGRLNTNGTIDATFTATADWFVNSVVVQGDGRILVGGDFDVLGGQPRSRIGRLAATGAIDGTFNPGVAGAIGAVVFSMALQADGRILVGGWFDTLGGQGRDNIGRLNTNGTLDVTFNPGADDLVGTLAVQTDGKILAGGIFTTLAGQSRTNLGRLNADGSLDGTFTLALMGGDFPSVYFLALQADGKVCFGGEFTSVNDSSRQGFARLNATDPATQTLAYAGTTISWLRGGTSPEILTTAFDHSSNGVAWTSLGAGTRLADGWQRTSATIPAGRTLRARGFSPGAAANQWFVESYLGKPLIFQQPANNTNNYGAAASFYVSAGGSEPLAHQWFKNGSPLVNQGNITGATNATLQIAQASNGDEGNYTVVITNLSGGVTSTVATLTVNDPIITQHPASTNRVAGGSVRLSVGAIGTPTLSYQWYRDGILLPGANGTLLTLSNLTVSDAGLYTVVASNAGGMATSKPAGLTVNGANVNGSFNPGAAGTVYALAVQRDGKILVGGSISTLGGVARSGLGRLNANGTIDLTFDLGAIDGRVNTIALQTNGAILVGGNFTTMGGLTRHYLARVNANGTMDTSFNPNVSSFLDFATTVNALAVQADGKIIVGGVFDTLVAGERHHIGRISAAGVLDSFNPGPNYWANSEPVNCIAVQPDGKVVVGGAFAKFGGQGRTNLARATAAGGLDSAFNPDVRGTVNAVALQADGKILVGGSFNNIAGQTFNNIARLHTNGTLDVTFNPGASSSVYSLAVQADGKILLGGDFTVLGGQPRNRIARLNADGSLDLTFNPGANNSVTALAVQPDGMTLVGGSFSTLASASRSRIGRLISTTAATQTLSHAGTTITWQRGGSTPEVWRTAFDHSADGTNWTIFGAGTRVAGGWQRTGATLPAGRTLRAVGQVVGGLGSASGWFVESYLGKPVIITQPQNRTNGGTTTATFQVTAGGSEPMTYQWQKGGVNLSNAGNVSGAGSNLLALASVLKADEGGYRVIVSNSFGSATSLVATLTVVNPLITNQPAGVAGSPGGNVTFSVGVVGTSPISYQWYHEGVLLPGATGPTLQLQNLTRSNAGYYTVVATNLDGSITSVPALLTVNMVTADSAFSPQADSSVYPLAVQPDGKILIAGDFYRNGEEEILWRFGANGGLLDTFPDDNPGYAYTYDALAVQTDGKILVGGYFSTLGGQPHSCIGRFNTDLTLDATFTAGAGTPPDLDDEPEIEGLAVQADGKILVGGYFTTLVGASRNNIGRLNTNGTLDTFNPGADYYVNTIALQTDGKILVGGQFASLGGQTRLGIGRLNANGSVDASFSSAVDQAVSCIAVQADGKILVGGYFTTLSGQPRSYFGRLNTNGTVDTTFNPSPNGRVRSIAVQADGKILVAGGFTAISGLTRLYIARLNPDGSLDPIFNPSVSSSVNAVGLQADGKILVGGNFFTIAGQSRSCFARLYNTDPVIESFGYSSTNLFWLRGGTSPEVWRTTFERSTNGVNWTSLGAGTRVPGGWRLNYTNLPASGMLRTRGHVTGGYQNASAWFVESIFDLTPKLQLSLVRSNASLILSWTGPPGPYQVQQSTNVSNPNSWQDLGGPIQTSSMTVPIGQGQRFLRVRAQ